MGKSTKRKQEIKAQELDIYEKAIKKKFKKHSKNKELIFEEVVDWYQSKIMPIFQSYVRKSISDFHLRSFNKILVMKNLIKFVFIKYQVPDFIFDDFFELLSSSKNIQPNDHVIKWFFEITTGKSFYKCNSGIFTKKEAHLFQNAPSVFTSRSNIIWCKCTSRKIDKDVMRFIIQMKRIQHDAMHPKWNGFYDFIKRTENDLKVNNIREISDFVYCNPLIPLYGRTWKSTIRLVHEWHNTRNWAEKADSYRDWSGIHLSLDTQIDDKYGTVWKFKELTNSNELLQESNDMHHCVITYKTSCISGSSRIFSLSSDEFGCNQFKKQLTIELTRCRGNEWKPTQIRGKYNRHPNEEELKIIRKWNSDTHMGIAV